MGAGCVSWVALAFVNNTIFNEYNLPPSTSVSNRVKARDTSNNFEAYSNTTTVITSPVSPY